MKKVILFLTVFCLGYSLSTFEFAKFGQSFITQVKAQSSDFKYYYAAVQRCYRWNLSQRILATIGIEPYSISDVQVNGVPMTVVAFHQELTVQQKTSVDAIMVDSPEFPPPSHAGTKYAFQDLYENRASLKTKFGLNFWVYYSCDGGQIYLYFDNVLTQGQKNQVATEVGNLLVEVP